MADTLERAGAEHCGSCGAAMRPDAPWCTLCLTPRPAPEPVPVPAARQVAQSALLYPGLTPSRIAGEPAPDQPGTWPCLRCRAPVPLAAGTCPECGAAFLEGSGSPVASLRLPIVGDLATKSRTQSFAIAAGLGITLAVLAVGAVLLLAALF